MVAQLVGDSPGNHDNKCNLGIPYPVTSARRKACRSSYTVRCQVSDVKTKLECVSKTPCNFYFRTIAFPEFMAWVTVKSVHAHLSHEVFGTGCVYRYHLIN